MSALRPDCTMLLLLGWVAFVVVAAAAAGAIAAVGVGVGVAAALAVAVALAVRPLVLFAISDCLLAYQHSTLKQTMVTAVPCFKPSAGRTAVTPSPRHPGYLVWRAPSKTVVKLPGPSGIVDTKTIRLSLASLLM